MQALIHRFRELSTQEQKVKTITRQVKLAKMGKEEKIFFVKFIY